MVKRPASGFTAGVEGQYVTGNADFLLSLTTRTTSTDRGARVYVQARRKTKCSSRTTSSQCCHL